MAHIEPKAIRQFIMPNKSPIDVLHKATFITMALLPVYIHVFMALTMEPQCTGNCTGKFSVSYDQASGWSNKTEEKISGKEGLAAGVELRGFGIPQVEETIPQQICSPFFLLY